MDWNFKNHSWDFSEFEQGTIPNIDSISGSSDFSVDLKLGQVIDSRNEVGGNLKVTKMALSPSGSSKRARAVNNTVQTAMCLVDGCTADLSNCREYHRRHKVCEVHSKTPQVSINGQKQRFCQQCSRFHSLEEFDEGKRSCRKRLDGHNRRRRKPQPDTLSRAASLFSSHQGTTMLQFSSPHAYALANPSWTGVVTNQIPLPESSSGSCKVAGKQQFNLFHDGGTTLAHHRVSPPKAGQPPLLVFRDEYEPPARVVHSDCALSLLSSSSSCTTTMSHVVHQPHSNPFSTTANRFEPGLSYGGLESIMVPNGSDGCTGVAHIGADHDASAHGHEAPQTLPFYWD